MPGIVLAAAELKVFGDLREGGGSDGGTSRGPLPPGRHRIGVSSDLVGRHVSPVELLDLELHGAVWVVAQHEPDVLTVGSAVVVQGAVEVRPSVPVLRTMLCVLNPCDTGYHADRQENDREHPRESDPAGDGVRARIQEQQEGDEADGPEGDVRSLDNHVNLQSACGIELPQQCYLIAAFNIMEYFRSVINY